MNILASVVRKDGKLVFDSIDLLAWAILDNTDYPQEIVGLFGAKTNGAKRVAWRLKIDEQAKRIRCFLSEKDALVPGAAWEFGFRPGTLVLEDLQGMENPLEARAKKFRTVKFQTFVDDFGLQSVQHYAKAPGFWPAACQWRSYKEGVRSVSVVKGGAVKIIRGKTGNIRGFKSWKQTCWALEVIQTADGEVRILHTNMLGLRKLREGLLDCGVQPVR